MLAGKLENLADGGPLLCRGDYRTRCSRSLPVTVKGSRPIWVRVIVLYIGKLSVRIRRLHGNSVDGTREMMSAFPRSAGFYALG